MERFHKVVCLAMTLIVYCHYSNRFEVAAFEFKKANLGAQITRVASDTYFSDIYVGGENFVASLSDDMYVYFNITIGPVKEKKHCYPNPAPCSNTVRSLMIDETFNRLIVCGSAYGGTCTTHSIPNICDWRCVSSSAYNSSKSNILSATGSKRQYAMHFLEPEVVDFPPDSFENVECDDNCRSRDFASECQYSFNSLSIPAPMYSNPIKSETAMTREAEGNYSGFEIDNMLKFYESRLIVAGDGDRPDSQSSSPHQPLISVRNISHDMSENFRMFYSEEQDANNETKGIFVDQEKLAGFNVDFKLSFGIGKFSYFLSVQKGLCNGGDRNSSCTMLSRVSTNNESLLPYIEIPLKCKYGKDTYPLLTASVLGTVGLQQTLALTKVPVLIMAFGKSREPDGTTPDPQLGTALCAYTVDYLDKGEFDYARDLCRGDGMNVPWAKPAKENCQLIRAKSFGGSEKAVQFFKGETVTALFTHTQTIYKSTGISVLLEKMHLYVVHSKKDGIKLSKTLEVTIQRRGIYTQVVSTPFPGVDENEFDLTSPSHPESLSPPAGIVDNSRAMMYLGYGSEIVSLNLDFCRQYTSCTVCQKGSQARCQWCQSSASCMDKDSAFEACGVKSEGTCPPWILDFEPKSVPISGGTTLTVRGTHLGQHDVGTVIVSLCNHPCNDVNSNVNRLTCTVNPMQPFPGLDTCKIAINVTGNKDSHGIGYSATSLVYVVPRLTSFSPSFGPVSGGTMVEMWGDNIVVGSQRTVEVAGVACDVLPNMLTDERERLACHLKTAPGRENVCGPIVLKIDNFVTNSSSDEYCFRPDPQITSINPLTSTESGGVKLVVEGSYLNSTTSVEIVLSIVSRKGLDSKRKLSFTAPCTRHNGTMATCIAPNIRNATKSVFDTQPLTNEIQAAIAFKLGGVEKRAANLDYFFIHRDPFLFRMDESAFIYPKMPNRIFRLSGKSIPHWLDPSEVVIMIGRARCQVHSMAEEEICCQVNDVLSAYSRDFRRIEVITTPAPTSTSTTTASLTSTTTTINPDHSISQTAPKELRTTAHKTQTTTSAATEPPFPTTSTDTTVLPFNRTGPSGESTTNHTDSTWNESSTGSGIQLSDFQSEHPGHSTYRPGRTQQIPLLYPITVQIGNWKQDLGNVTVGPRPRVVEEFDPSTDSVSLSPKLLGILAGGALLVILFPLVVCLVCLYRKKKRIEENPFYMGSLSARSTSHTGSGEAAIPSLTQILHSVLEPSKRDAATELLIDRKELTLGKSVGSGNFGTVYEGSLSRGKNPSLKVAVKTLQDPLSHSIDLTSFVQEAVFMMDFSHAHVLGLIGLSEDEPGVPYVILPYMENGDLLTYVRDVKRDLSVYDVIQFGADICSGMVYLSSLKFVHRDLAARNCMLDTHYRVKVADFGLCRDIYEKGYYTSDNKKKLPIRWMALESIENGAYSSKSDVWSMGVVLWELLTRGMTPYPGVDGWDIINFLRKRRLAPPFFCPESLYRLMMNCWAKDPSMRPTFKALEKELLIMIDAWVTPGTPELSKSERNLSRQKSEPNPVPKITIERDASGEKQNVTAADTSTLKVKGPRSSPSGEPTMNASGLSSSVMSLPRSAMVKNAKITAPGCYEYRDVKKEAMAEYIQLVDNYEPAPRFAHPFLRSKKKRNKSSKRTKAKTSKELQVPQPSRSSGRKAMSTVSDNYSFPVEVSSTNEYVIPLSGSAGNLLSAVKKTNSGFLLSDGGNYYELEHNQRASDASMLDSSCHSSVMFDKTGSLGSLLEQGSGTTSSCQSVDSSNSPLGSRRPNSNRSSTLTQHKHSYNPHQANERGRASSLRKPSLKEEDSQTQL